MALFAITPTAENGERFPAFAPLATMSAVRNGGRPERSPVAIASGANSATVESAPGPTDDKAQAIDEEEDGNHARIAARGPNRPIRQRFQASVRVSQGEQQGDTRQGEEERNRKAAHDRVGPRNRPHRRRSSHAKHRASHPTLIRDVIDRPRAMTSATRERTSGTQRASCRALRLSLDHSNRPIGLVQQEDLSCRGRVESQVRACRGRLALRAVLLLNDLEERARRRAGGRHEEHAADRILAAFGSLSALTWNNSPLGMSPNSSRLVSCGIVVLR